MNVRRLAARLALAAAFVACAAGASNGQPAPATPAPAPAVLVATRSFLLFAQGDQRQGAVAGAVTGNYRLLGGLSGGGVLVSYDDASSTSVEQITPALESRKVKAFPRGTLIFAGNDGFLAYEPTSQLMRRYDAGGALVGTPIAALGAGDALGVADSMVVLGGGRLRVYDRGGRLRRDTIFAGHSLVPMPQGRFAVFSERESEVQVYDADLNLSASLRYVGLPVRRLASAPDGALAVIAGTPACTLSNAEVDVFTDLHAQPIARIHSNLTSPSALAIGPDAVYVANAPCRSGDDGSIAVFGRDGSSRGTMLNVGVPTSLYPFRKS